MAHLKVNKSKAKFFPFALEGYIENPRCRGNRLKIKCNGVYYRAELYNGRTHSALYVGQRIFMIGIKENVALITL